MSLIKYTKEYICNQRPSLIRMLKKLGFNIKTNGWAEIETPYHRIEFNFNGSLIHGFYCYIYSNEQPETREAMRYTYRNKRKFKRLINSLK